MNKTLQRLSCALALALPLASAMAADNRADIERRYQAERQACMAQADPESRRACLRDAGAVRQEALSGARNAEVDDAQLRRNAIARCVVHKDKLDRAMCERMALGEGTASGSVEGGGVIREFEVEVEVDPGTTVPAR